MSCQEDNVSSITELLSQYESDNSILGNQELAKQNEFLNMIEFRSAYLRAIEKEELISLGLIQTLSKSILFVNDSQLLAILKYLRKNFFIQKTNSQDYFRVFIEHSGLANLFQLLNENLNKNLEITDFIISLIEKILESDELRVLILNCDKMLRAFWNLIDLFKSNYSYLQKAFKFLESLIKSVESDKRFKVKFIESIKNLLDNIRVDMTFEDYDEAVRLFNEFKSRKEKTMDSEQEEIEEELDQEEEEKLRRVKDFILSTSNVTSEPEVPKLVNCAQDSSDDEADDMFVDELMNVFSEFMHLPFKPSQNLPIEDTKQENRDYKYPKIIWNQTKTEVILKIKQKNLKDCVIEYTNAHISFRGKSNNDTFGFEFDLFAEIDKDTVNSETRSEYFEIILKKKVDAIWMRLLSSVNKPSYIKSEYNNIYTSSSEDELLSDTGSESNKRKHRKNKKKNLEEFGEFLENSRGANRNKLVQVYHDKDSSTTSDSESDFDDFNTDMKEIKDYRWD